ncbi:MAG: hypothetical protein ACPGVU_18130 [Limisphaerales bacterium]
MDPSHSLPGINVDDALSRLGIDWNKYLGLLHRFTDDVKEPLASLQSSVGQQDWEGARRHTLTISVECMKLCADELRDKIRGLDNAIRSQTDNVSTLAQALAADIARLNEAISSNDNPFEDAGVQEILGSIYNYKDIGETLWKLESALYAGNANAADELLAHWEHLGIPPDLLEGFKQIKSLTAVGSLDDAAAIASILKSGLPKTA